MATIAIAPDGCLEEGENEAIGVRLRFLQLGPTCLVEVIRRHNFLLPLARVRLLAESCQLLLRGDGIMHVDCTVLGLLGVKQSASDGFTDSSEICGAKVAVTAIQELDALALEVHDETNHDTPVEERTGADERVGQAGGRGFFLQGLLNLDLVSEDWKGGSFLIEGVGAELGRDEAVDLGFGSGFDKAELDSNSNGG